MEAKHRIWTGKEMVYDVIPVNSTTAITAMQGFTPAWCNYRMDVVDTMMHFGFKDIAGREIYEKDIVIGNATDEIYCTGLVLWDKTRFCFEIIILDTDSLVSVNIGTLREIKKLGNIYDNPKLINSRKINQILQYNELRE